MDRLLTMMGDGMFHEELWRTEEWRGPMSRLIWNRLTDCKTEKLYVPDR
jgi:hypothetical protein